MLRKGPLGVWEDISDTLKKGLLYSAEDVEASREFVLICPYKRLQNNDISTLSGFDDPGAPPSFMPNVFHVFMVDLSSRYTLGFECHGVFPNRSWR